MVKGKLNRGNLNDWWIGRSIPVSRQNFRDIMFEFGSSFAETLLMKCYGLSLSDQYWINPVDTPLDWDKINFFNNSFSEDVGNILFGNNIPDGNFDFSSPDNTSDGWLKKKLKIINGKRCLIKGGSEPFFQEPLNEACASEVMKRLDINHIPYTVLVEDDLPYSVCEDFITSETDLISAYYLLQGQTRDNSTSKYQYFVNRCDELGIPNAKLHIDKMLVLDYLIFNTDRHYNNFGAVRNAETLEWIGIAPVFDSGTSLWCKQASFNPQTMRKIKIQPFKTSHEEQIKFVNDFSWLDLTALNGIEDDFRKFLSKSSQISDQRIEGICRMFKDRIISLERHIRNCSEIT